jgi:hypothetical protein
MEAMQYTSEGFVNRIWNLDPVKLCRIYHRRDYVRGSIFGLPFYPIPLLNIPYLSFLYSSRLSYFRTIIINYK